jgi:hypothetical protein
LELQHLVVLPAFPTFRRLLLFIFSMRIISAQLPRKRGTIVILLGRRN